MATVYTTSASSDPAYSFPTAGVYPARVEHTLTADLTFSGTDSLKVVALPEGASIIPELCSVFTADDPDAANSCTLALTVSDGTTTKTIISATTFQAANTRLVASAADIAALGFFKTGTKNYFAYLVPGAGKVDSGTTVDVVITYTMAGGRSESIT